MKKAAPTITSIDIADALNANYYIVLHLIHEKQSSWEKMGNKAFKISSFRTEGNNIIPMFTLNRNECKHVLPAFSAVDQVLLSKVMNRRLVNGAFLGFLSRVRDLSEQLVHEALLHKQKRLLNG